MNKNNYRLVFSRLRSMLVAVEETATATGKETGQTTVCSRGKTAGHTALFTLRQIAFAALALLGVWPSWSGAQIVPGGAHAPGVITTQNGLPQVNINRPSGAGVSMNTYGQFDVQQPGAILNNSPTIVQTQQAGLINGNPNFGPGQSARVIVNQVNSSAASQINGHLEVAGQRAEVVIANGSGISVNGGGFINMSRAILTTGAPNFAPDGSLAGFNVTGGNITIQGAGLNASDVDQVDLLARAVQANAAIHAKNLNVVTGANSIDHDTLNATPIAGNGPAPGVSIDVSNLGGMYANRIVLVGTENGVGVSTRGVLAAQSGDLTLTTQGKLVLAGQTNASGSMALSAHDGIDNSGTTYAQQSVTVNTAGNLTNSGTLAAQQDLTAHAASIASAGTLGAGVDADGSLAQAGNLAVTADGVLSAHGNNAAGGNATLSGAALDLGGSETQANGNLALTASSGELNTSSATTTAGGSLSATAAGTLTNDNGSLTSGAAQTITAGALSNRSGQIVSDDRLTASVAGAASNAGGTMQAAAQADVSAASLDNTTGRIVSLNGDGITLTTTGALINGAGGTIGTNGALSLKADTLANQGKLSAADNATVRAQGVDNHAGSITAGGVLNASSGGALNNAGGTLSGASTTVSASSIDNTNGDIDGDALAVSTPGSIVANVIATGAGAAVGGDAGTFSGYNVDRFNRQLHPNEKREIKNLANWDADKEHRLEAAGCALVHCAAEFAPGTADSAKYSALEQEGAAYTAEQAQLKNYNGTYFSTDGYGGMVQQTPGSSMFKYSADDAQADQKSSLAAMAAQRPGAIDFVTLQAGAGLGGSVTVNLYNGNVYAGGSISASRGKGVGIVFGMIPDNVGMSTTDKAEATDKLLVGQSVGGNGCLYGVCGGLNHSVGGQTAIEVGIGVGGVAKPANPGGNGSGGYSIPLFAIPWIGNSNAKH